MTDWKTGTPDFAGWYLCECNDSDYRPEMVFYWWDNWYYESHCGTKVTLEVLRFQGPLILLEPSQTAADMAKFAMDNIPFDAPSRYQECLQKLTDAFTAAISVGEQSFKPPEPSQGARERAEEIVNNAREEPFHPYDWVSDIEQAITAAEQTAYERGKEETAKKCIHIVDSGEPWVGKKETAFLVDELRTQFNIKADPPAPPAATEEHIITGTVCDRLNDLQRRVKALEERR